MNWADATSNTYPDWLQVTFNGVKSIGDINVISPQDTYMAPVEPTPTMTFTQYGLIAYQVQYWTGSAWADVPGGNVTGNNLTWRRFLFSAILTDRIRVLVNSAVGNNLSTLTELEAWTVPPPPKISGSVTATGAPLAGVGFAASSGGTCTASDAAGQYSCNVAPGWSGNVTPSLAGYSFSPASRTYSGVQADQTGQDFAAALLGPQIVSGTRKLIQVGI